MQSEILYAILGILSIVFVFIVYGIYKCIHAFSNRYTDAKYYQVPNAGYRKQPRKPKQNLKTPYRKAGSYSSNVNRDSFYKETPKYYTPRGRGRGRNPYYRGSGTRRTPQNILHTPESQSSQNYSIPSELLNELKELIEVTPQTQEEVTEPTSTDTNGITESDYLKRNANL